MPTPIPTGALTVSLTEALSDLTNACIVSGRSPQTTQLFALYVGKMAAFLAQDGITDVDQVTPAHVTAFLAHERKRALKPASLSVSLRTIRRFFQWCVEQDAIGANPARKVLAPRVVVEPVRGSSMTSR